MYTLLRRLLFCLQPETAHGLALGLIRLAGALPPARAVLRALYRVPEARPVRAFGLTFPNPVGPAAGYDKDGLGWRGLACLGFGHLEIGTVTPAPQPGNPRPRVFRLPESGALINRMGFPGLGAAFVARRLAGARPPGLVIGANLGKQKETPLQDAAADYEKLMEVMATVADYLVVNVSSPNTPGLRELQTRAFLEGLLCRLAAMRETLQRRLDRRVPLLVKLAPDLSDPELDDALEAMLSAGMDGVIATNTTIGRPGIGSPFKEEAGGLSGRPLGPRSTEMIRAIHKRTEGKLPIIGVGGVASPDDAKEKLDAGAVLVQVYTGLIYQGPGLVKRILLGL